MNVRHDCRFAETHEWAKLLPDGTVLVGISDYAQGSLGDITYVQLPEVGTTFAPGAIFGVVESVKAASDLYVPLGGRVLEVNDAVRDAPELVNREPYDGGWMLKMQPDDPEAVAGLLSPEDYADRLG